jgi:hypothetical protein
MMIVSLGPTKGISIKDNKPVIGDFVKIKVGPPLGYMYDETRSLLSISTHPHTCAISKQDNIERKILKQLRAEEKGQGGREGEGEKTMTCSEARDLCGCRPIRRFKASPYKVDLTYQETAFCRYTREQKQGIG